MAGGANFSVYFLRRCKSALRGVQQNPGGSDLSYLRESGPQERLRLLSQTSTKLSPARSKPNKNSPAEGGANWKGRDRKARKGMRTGPGYRASLRSHCTNQSRPPWFLYGIGPKVPQYRSPISETPRQDGAFRITQCRLGQRC
ncbi:hypothetical protein RHECIAT_CH0003423 [Rhizobium etli CIAT 652]|uniref:Uncharacterized protein n=1 Tax=Rhizobium etli (strain CIAT 652) TaxID=491916 RepID=B3PWD3_RHIE6|nr:hypothetical protein RHECIAT_CH0003423 [Rhizobium etli CIAT 652]